MQRNADQPKKSQTTTSQPEEYDLLVLGSGAAGKLLSWTLAPKGMKTAVVERKYVGGACPNIACLPSKNIVHSAKVASFFFRSREFGISKDNCHINMEAVRQRKRDMVQGLVDIHLANYKASGAELIMGSGRFVGPKTIEVTLADGAKRLLRGKHVVINTGTRATIDPTPGLAETNPMTHVEALELDHIPEHLLVVGGGYVGLELAQAMRRFGSRVTVIERNPRLIHREDQDVSEAMQQLFKDEGIDVLTNTRLVRVLLNTTNVYTFRANAGDSINLRLGTTNFYGDLQLFGPDGTLVDTTTVIINTDLLLADTAETNGTYTVLVSSDTSGGTGSYVLHLAQIPEPFVVPAGDDGGVLTNGANVTGTITLADIDMWTFRANAGDAINLRIGTTNFNSKLQLYGPDGTLLDTTTVLLGTDLTISDTAPTNGTYTVLVSADQNNGTGTYVLRLAQIPEPFVVPAGDEGGPLTNGVYVKGTISLADMDMWTFPANHGDIINLNLGTTNFDGEIDLFGPDGTQLDSTSAVVNTNLTTTDTAQGSGIYTVIISSEKGNGAGTYALRLEQAAGPALVASGTLTNGAFQVGTIPAGIKDLYTFAANAGDNIIVRLGTTNFYGELQLFGPSGTSLASTVMYTLTDLYIYGSLPQNGLYTVLVSSKYLTDSGTYIVRLAQAPEPFVVPPGDEGGALTGLKHYTGAITLADLDLWSFTAFKGDYVSLQLSTTNFDGQLQLYGPNGALLATTVNYTNAIVTISGDLPSSGAFTAVVSSELSGGTGTYTLTVNGLSGGLKASSPQITGSNLTFAGAGGTPNASFVLYATTNMALPFALWSPVFTNHFDQYGVFNYTNTLNPGLQNLFFRYLEP